MKLNRIRKTVSVAASALMLGAVAVMTANAEDLRPKRSDVQGATPAVYCASWITGISRDFGARGQSIQLGEFANDMSNPTYFLAYYSFPKWWDQNLSAVTAIRASFLTPRGTINYAGSPRFNLEVENADGTPLLDINLNPVVIYLDPARFSSPSVGVWRDCDFTGSINGSILDSRGVQYTGGGKQSAWKKLIADPYYAGKKVAFMYLIQDASTGPTYVDKIRLDSALMTKAP